MLIPVPHNTTVTVITPEPSTKGGNLKLMCNVTKIGYPKDIIRYAWFRDYMELIEGNKYGGIGTKLLTLQVHFMFIIKSH